MIAERVQPEQVDAASADVHPHGERDRGQDGDRDDPAAERGDRVAEDDPAAVRRREQQPPREAALEVAGDPEAGEDTAERRRLEQRRKRTETPCSRPGSRSPERCEIPERPPANAVKKNSGKTSDGISSDLFVRKLCRLRQATPCATARAVSRARQPAVQRALRRARSRPRRSSRRSRSRARAPGRPSR